MDEELDPGPRRNDLFRNGRGRGNAGQRNRSPAGNWRRNRNDEQPRRGPDGPQNHHEGWAPRQPARRGGRAGFINVNADNWGRGGMQQNQEMGYPRGQHQRRGNPNHRNFNQDMGDNNHNPRRNADGNNRYHARKKYVGFKWLEEIAQSESQDALVKLTERKEAFIELMQSPIDRFDIIVLIIESMAKVCQSSFEELKLNLLRDTCNSNFVVSLKSYMMELPYPQAKAANNLYWKDQNAFWKNLIAFFESIINTSPTLALNKCRSLVEATSIACLEGLKEKHSYILPEEYTLKLKELRERMANFERVKETCRVQRRGFVPEEGTPPEHFRELSIMPTREDLLQSRAFVRPNIVDGAYQDVEHYLDVQFRLLREDCFGPLREGLGQYIEDPKRKRYDHIRVIHNVKFVKPYVSQTKIGSLVQIDMNSNRNFKRINWSNSKRFIFGSLVLFTKDNCKSFVVATILDRDPKFLMEGMIPVSLMGGEFNEQLYSQDDPYTMIESEVYFEPYYHVLRALQDPTFPEHLAMKQYIVDVNPEPKHPPYLDPATVFVTPDKRMTTASSDESESDESDYDDIEDGLLTTLKNLSGLQGKERVKFTVLQDSTWPGKDILQFNESQLEAYKLSLTHELAVIQGPPGTGKTYLGIKVAKTLYQNLKRNMKGCIMLIICYTNHALDQFLEALLKVTPSIARIGGQSRNEKMGPINLTNLRRNISTHSNSHQVFIGQKIELKDAVSEFQKAMVHLDVLLNGVLKCEELSGLPEIELMCNFYNGSQDGEDALSQWLFENTRDYRTNVEALLLEDNETNNEYNDLEKENRKRTGVHLDDQENIESQHMIQRAQISSFSIEQTNSQIRELISQYKACPEIQQQREILWVLQNVNCRKELFNDMSQYRGRRSNVRITDRTNFQRIAPMERWSLYFMWIQERVINTKEEIGELQARVDTATTAYEEARMLLDMQVLQDKKVVGMTTSGAARMRKLLQTLAPPIVIVEEAAEVLEQHIITSLTKSCQHLILIGDHQQLRPSASHMKLAKHYQIEVSLFERMISNGIHSRRLSVQHRMRPEIAALICPHIYPELQNHPTVYDFPNVMGMTKNMFFLTHDYKEEVVVENMSRTNHKEADLVLALANYLMQQGYTAEDVTILAAYKGQMFYMRKESENYNHLTGVKITVVDNYQGEESKIILLSLVRNNDDNKIGFLGTSNRICVALSRAKEGFYIFGNIENLKANSELWKNIARTLENGKSLGKSLILKCQNHPNNMATINKVEDFDEVPEGGCKAPCGISLRQCGHKCLLFCHGYDREHATNYTRCPRSCERIRCDLGHVCPKKCYEECGPCKRKVKKTLPCGHEADIYCHLEPDDPSVKCFTTVEVTLPDCSHKAEKMCHANIKNVQCPVKCEYRVEKCGHGCLRKCHVKNDPDHEKYLCMKACAKAKVGCTAGLEGDRGDHQCVKKCHEECDNCNVPVIKRRSTCNHTEYVKCVTNIDEILCMKKCSRKLPCNHFCKKKCSETCGDCMEMVMKELQGCHHKLRMMCQQEPTRELCVSKCERIMTCGHKCTGICGEECDPTLCKEPSNTKVASPCGHQVVLPCNLVSVPADEETLASLCTVACNAELACKHVCRGNCARCHQGRLHASCSQTCHQINICEHQCEEPCNQICPPCKKRCEVQCQHSRCRQLCGEACAPCQEKCGRRCPHGACRKRCGEACARAACDEACARLLRCGHACRGLCGEPCPPVCALCDPDTFPRDFTGDEFDDDAKFILLQDCGHVMEVENMDNMMLGDRDTIEIRKCPYCRKPIINTGRYKDFVNKMFKEKINPIKMKIYGTEAQIAAKKKELHEKLNEFRTKYMDVLRVDTNIKKVYLNLQSVSKTTKKVSKLQLDMESMCLIILDMIADSYNKYLNNKLTELNNELKKQTESLCRVFTFKVNNGVMFKISEQQQKDMSFEIRRLNSIVQLAKLIGHPSYSMSKSIPTVTSAYTKARSAVFNWNVFDENKAMASLKDLQEAMNVSGIVSRQEKDMIVKAMGFKAGHWYECPKGHIYCIGECGGAMEESKCPECGAKIGGLNHALTSGNRHAGEMDGSSFAAWSEEYNNMANFDL